MKKSILTLLILSIIFQFSVCRAQTKVDQNEITSSVQELTDFHDIIYPMWHDAYPSKDYEKLKSYVPMIKSSVEAINKAKLPGILREKQAAWTSQLAELNKAAQSYYTAAGSNDNNALLAAAERLHSGYEKMVRVIRPAIKEIDDFHQSLYVIYHKLLPDSKFSEIAGMTDILITKSQAIVNYPHDKLQKRLGDNVAKYDASAKKLYNSTVSLKEILNSNDAAKKKAAVESMHSAYEELDALFK
jgi:hypothetical protein